MRYLTSRLLISLVLMACLAATAQAQRARRFGLQVGMAAPIGDFKKDHFEDDYPPLARRGANVQGNYRVDIKPYLAVGATAGFRFNRFDLDMFAAPDDELVQHRKASGWKTTYALADIYLQTPPGTVFGFVKGSLGAALNKSPEVRVETTFGPIRHSADPVLVPAYGLSSGFAIQNGRFLLTVEIGVLRTRPSFEITDAKGNRSTLKQPMHTVNSMLGIGYTL
ncbi:hypothetical protein [Pontibacter ramchanderi]|uniref:Outer membrane protein with beta-barrel domain n=1 Tax=Pontibacter ramchanderi TaxID=1179743 RepID=A0A2N3U8I6_9BACT|nr:hypothetical protein [Pontibacter ramchanderi]PKV63063.1 hypothetical protein BD749_2900 [Pontibacter ramchanderi]